MKTPVIFIFFNKIDTTKIVFERIRLAKPQKLYLVSDGPRESRNDEKNVVESLRGWVEQNIDWECDVIKDYSDHNMGCKNRVISGITNAFKIFDRAIIIEDDCKPRDDFFTFCEAILDKYIDNPEVMMVAGSNLLPRDYYTIKTDYTFSKNVWIWGWATWKRAWDLYDPDIRDWNINKNNGFIENIFRDSKRQKQIIDELDLVCNHEMDTWDYQWGYCVWKNNGLCVIPNHTLIENLGFGIPEALHTVDDMPDYLKKTYKDIYSYDKDIQFIETIERNNEFDFQYDKMMRQEYSIFKRLWRRIRLYRDKFIHVK